MEDGHHTMKNSMTLELLETSLPTGSLGGSHVPPQNGVIYAAAQESSVL